LCQDNGEALSETNKKIKANELKVEKKLRSSAYPKPKTPNKKVVRSTPSHYFYQCTYQ
jgi:hypothetical protein